MGTTISIILITSLVIFLSYKAGYMVKTLEHEIEMADFRIKILTAMHKKIEDVKKVEENVQLHT